MRLMPFERTCTNPAPRFGGAMCPGSATSEVDCGLNAPSNPIATPGTTYAWVIPEAFLKSRIPVPVSRDGWTAKATPQWASQARYLPHALLDGATGDHFSAYASANNKAFNWVQIDFGTVINVRNPRSCTYSPHFKRS